MNHNGQKARKAIVEDSLVKGWDKLKTPAIAGVLMVRHAWG
jgi:hypothetical protein